MKNEFNFLHTLRVRYAEIDGQGIVFNANYLIYISVAIMEYFRNLGFDYKEFAKNQEFDLALVKITLEYISPAFFDDIIEVGVKVVGFGNKSFNIHYEMFRNHQDDPIFKADAIYVNFNTKLKKAQPVPDEIKEKVNKFENKLSY
ncbi:MAG: thioesterase family protein [Deferribacterota bacterium]|nr:thioesterase family protein [Deferribacterota bacterium]